MRIRLAVFLAVFIGGFATLARAQETPEASADGSFVERIPATTARFKMIRVPPGTLEYQRNDGTSATVEIPELWFSQAEVTWDLYDIWVYELDAPVGGDSDASSRPSKPYIPPDRGFGHAGYPAISLSRPAAIEFCMWLSELTGKRYRLATPQEWEYAARAGATTPYSFGDNAATIDEHAWHAGTTPSSTQGVKKKKPNAWGLYDMHGNVAEWVMDANPDKPIALGGSWKQEPAGLAFGQVLRQDSSWQESDPQIPKSTWWLSDCGFVGIRLVCEGPVEATGESSDDSEMKVPEVP